MFGRELLRDEASDLKGSSRLGGVLAEEDEGVVDEQQEIAVELGAGSSVPAFRQSGFNCFKINVLENQLLVF